MVTGEFDRYWQVVQRLHILRPAEDGETVVDIPVDAPGWQFFHNKQSVPAGDGDTALIRFRHANHIGVLDLATGAITEVPTGARLDESLNLQAAISPTHIAFHEEGREQAHVVRRDDPTGEQRLVDVPQYETGTAFVGLAGDWLLTTHLPPGPGGPLTAVPLGGGEPRTLLPSAEPQIGQIPSGGAVVVGRTADGGWGPHRVEVTTGGTLLLRES